MSGLNESIRILKAEREGLALVAVKKAEELDILNEEVVAMDKSIAILERRAEAHNPNVTVKKKRARKKPSTSRTGLTKLVLKVVDERGEVTNGALCKAIEEAGIQSIQPVRLNHNLNLYMQHHPGVLEVEKVMGKPTHWVYKRPGFVRPRVNGHDLGMGGFAG